MKASPLDSKPWICTWVPRFFEYNWTTACNK